MRRHVHVVGHRLELAESVQTLLRLQSLVFIFVFLLFYLLEQLSNLEANVDKYNDGKDLRYAGHNQEQQVD
jgi:hypothetical protein